MKQVIRRDVKGRGRVSATEAQRLERERIYKMMRDKRMSGKNQASPMNINRRSTPSVTSRNARSPARSPVRSPARSQRQTKGLFSRMRRSVSPPQRRDGVTKIKRSTIKNSTGKTYALQKRAVVQGRAKSCSMVYTAPQQGAVCWFAAIFTSLFFSQYIRPCIKSHALALSRTSNARAVDAARAIIEILKGYEVGKVSPRVVQYMQPREFLDSLRKVNPTYFTKNPSGREEAHYGPYEHAMFAFLKIPHISIGYVNGKLVYSGFNVNLPLAGENWGAAMKSSKPVGDYVNISNPKIIMIHRDSGEDWLQSQWQTPPPQIGSVAGYNSTQHMPKITYNGRVYILDSCIIGAELKTNTCSMGHAVAGVTCNGQRYVYNGWTARSADPAMKGSSSSAVSDMPCALGRYEWDKNKSFCINTSACRFQNARPNQIGKELCFNAVQRSTVMYVRADIAQGSYKVGRLVKPQKARPVRK